MKIRIGTIVKVSPENDNENYNSFKGRLLEVTHIYTNSKENPFYDDSMNGEKLCEFNDYVNPHKKIPCALYEYELELYRY